MSEKMDLNLNELEKVTGGDSKAFELGMAYHKYVDSLMAKYQCADKGVNYLLTVCTPEEKNKVHEMCEAVMTLIR